MENNGNGIGTLSVKEAADQLGISPRGVRQRISRGRLKATQINGEWLVYLGEHAEPVPENNGTGNTQAEQAEQAAFPEHNGNGTERPRTVVPRPQEQLDAIMQSWLEPLTKTIKEQAEEIGKLKAELIQERREKEALVELVESVDKYDDNPPMRGFWARLFGG